ncbi:MAG: PDZ domain-containing protein, partial [Phycisphaerales bacterium]
EYPATVVGTDPETDLALVKVDATTLPAASWGDSDAIDQGDWVVAVGSPFGLDHTVTSGIVSAKQREGITPTAFENYIQTDAAINPGNSGGPLVNLRGEVVGINTAIRTQGGGNDGIGFAIPSSTVKDVVDGLRGGKVSRGYLGIMTQPLDAEMAKSFGFSGHGVLVADAIAGEPAANAGLQSEDIITKVNGKPVDSPRSLVSSVASLKPGEIAKLDVFRAGKSIQLNAKLGERPNQREGGESASPAPAQKADEGARLGVRVAPLNDELREQFKIGDEKGVAIVEVQPGSPAAKAGLEAGDLVLAVGGTAVESPEDFIKAVKATSKDEPLRLRVKSGGMTRFMLVK